jgi:chemotaxis response regulator CheB
VAKSPRIVPAAEPLGRKPVAIVGIGASAGGLEAFSEFLRALAVDTGMASC